MATFKINLLDKEKIIMKKYFFRFLGATANLLTSLRILVDLPYYATKEFAKSAYRVAGGGSFGVVSGGVAGFVGFLSGCISNIVVAPLFALVSGFLGAKSDSFAKVKKSVCETIYFSKTQIPEIVINGILGVNSKLLLPIDRYSDCGSYEESVYQGGSTASISKSGIREVIDIGSDIELEDEPKSPELIEPPQKSNSETHIPSLGITISGK